MAVDPDGRGTAIDDFNPKYDIKNITVEQVYEKVIVQLKEHQNLD